MVGLILRFWLAGVSLGPKSNQKNNKFQNKYKDDQNGLIHPENGRLAGVSGWPLLIENILLKLLETS